MKTVKASPAKIEEFKQLQANSVHYKIIKEEASNFYANGAKWDGLEENSKRHHQACKDWEAEYTAAGFYRGMRVLHVIKAA